MIEFERIAREVINSMRFVVPVKSFIDNGNDTFTVTTNYTAWLTKWAFFYSGNDKYQVIDFEYNTSLTIQPVDGSPLLEADFIINNPVYIHGTIRETANELAQIPRSEQKSPLIYLYERLRVNENPDPEARAKYSLSPTFYVLINFDEIELTEKSYEELIRPARNIETQLKQQLKRHKAVINTPFSANTIAITKFATSGANGYINNYLDANYAGLEVAFQISTVDLKKCRSYDVTPYDQIKYSGHTEVNYHHNIQPNELGNLTIKANHQLIVFNPTINGTVELKENSYLITL